MKLYSNLKIEIYSENFLIQRKNINKLIMPIKPKEKLLFENFKFIIFEVDEAKVRVAFYREKQHLYDFIVPPFKKRKFRIEDITKYNLVYEEIFSDSIFRVTVEGVKW